MSHFIPAIQKLWSRLLTCAHFDGHALRQRRTTGARRRILEQLEARRVFAAAIGETTYAPQMDWVTTSIVDHYSRPEFSPTLPEGEHPGYQSGGGQTNPPQLVREIYYSPRVPGYVRDSNHRKTFVDDSDVVKLSMFSNGSWYHELYFDGSDVGLSTGTENIDAFAIRADGTLLISTTGRASVPGLVADNEDLMLFTPTRLGEHTQGTWSLYVNGSDLGLSSWEGIDGVAELPDGRLIISTERPASVPGISQVQPEDLLLLTLSKTGNHTQGSWQHYFDGSDVYLSTSNENVDGIAVEGNGSKLHLSTRGFFRVYDSQGHFLVGDGGDIFTFEPTQLGSTTQGSYVPGLLLNASLTGLLCNSINAIEVRTIPQANQPPVIAAIGQQTINELQTFQLTLSANDPDTPQNQLTWSLVSAPDGAALSPTGQFTWTPTEAQGPGLFPVVVAVSDGNSSVQTTFTITVSEVNSAPTIAPMASPTIEENSTYNIQLSASDPDLPAQALTWSLVSGPAGAVVNPTTGRFAWRPTEAQGPGVFPIVVSVSDGAASTQATFTITVTEVNQAPTIAPITSPTIEVNTTYNVLLSASDADLPAQSLTWSLVSGPGGAVVNATTGRFAWRPTTTQGAGVYPIVVAVSDGLASTQATFTVTVVTSNQPPTIAPIASPTIEENTTYNVQLSASDPDLPAQTLTWSLVSGPQGAVVNATTGRFAWRPTEVQGPGVFPIVVAVSDGALSTQATFTITVTEVNQAPTLAPIASPTIEEGTTYNVLLSASDADLPAQTLTWSLVSGPLGAVVNATTGRFAWRPTEVQGPGVFPIVVAVSDGALSTPATFTVTVTEVNLPPVLAPIDNQTINLNQTFTLNLSATDPDLPANTLTYSLITAPAGATINQQTGQITWLANQSGSIPFTVSVSDEGGLSSNQSFTLSVVGMELRELDNFATELVQTLTLPNSNSALRIEFENPQFDTTSQRDIRDAFEIELLDLAGQKLVLPYAAVTEASFNWTEGMAPVSAASVTAAIASGSGQSSATINLNGLPAGTQFQLRLRLVNNDSDNNTVVRVTNVDFVDSNTPRPVGASFSPALVSTGAVNFAALQDVTGSLATNYGRSTLAGNNDRLWVDVQFENQGSQTLRGPMLLVIKNLSSLDVSALEPDGFSPDGHPYFRLNFVDDTLVPGQFTLTRALGFLNASNARFGYELQVLAVTNAAPSAFISSPLARIQAGNQYRYQAQVVDPEGDAITYSLVSGPATASIEATTGRLTWNTASSDVGLHRFTLRATDPFGMFIEQSFDLQVVAALQNRPPIFVSDPVTAAVASSGFEITTVATGQQPVGVSVISGAQGPRLVTAGAGDQSLSVHAGQKNDRFDDTTVYSTGEPRPTGALIDVGYSVDVGLPPFLVGSDRNEVLGMDQGDLNGDGILDLVVLTARNETTKPTGRVTIEMTRMLGDGDGNFSQPRVIATIPSTTYSELSRQATNLRIADLDGDGNPDVIALQKTTPRLITVRGLGDGSFEPVVFTTLTTALNDFRVEDLDQDGIVDIIGRNANISDLGWMRGFGDGTFAPFVPLAAGGGFWISAFASYAPRPYAVVDIDNDGDLDIVNSETNGGNIVVWLNDGSQNFTIGTTLDPPGSEGSYALHVGDFSGDERLDILSMNSSGSLDLFVRGPSGLSFTLQTQGDMNVWGRSGNLAGSDAPLDIDGDGDLDLILASTFDFDFLSPQVLINDGTGRFQRTDYQMVDFPGHIVATVATNRDVVRGVMLGDYNRDGVIDFSYMTSSYLGYDFHGVGIRLGTRPGEFGATRAISGISLNRNDTEVHAADFNGDGNVDLLSLLNARMSLGNGDGTFQPAFPATSIPNASTSGVVADFNLDGIPDYAATRGTGSGTKLYIAIGNGDGTFAASLGPDTPGMFYGYSDIRTADFNNDGWPDLIAKGSVERNIDVFLNNPASPGTFTRPFRTVQEVTGVNATGFDHTITTGDFNGDGNIDFVTVDQVTGVPFPSSGNPLKLQTFSGDGTGNFTITNEVFAFDDAMFTEFSFYYPYILQSGDVNSDGNLDIVSFSPLGFIIHIGDGNGSFTSLDRYDFERIPGFTKAGWLVDFDQDGQLDIVYNHAEETLSIRRGNGDGSFAPPQRVGTHAVGGSLTFADFDNDGHLDIATARAAGDSRPSDVGFYYGTRRGLVDQLAVDLDGDGNEEVLAINEANDRLKIFTGNNLDQLNRRDDLLTGRAPQAVATGDLNSDGRLEIITANRTGRSITLFSGSLASGYHSTEILVGSAPIDVLTQDINGDGHIDVLVLDEVASAIWVLSGSASGALSTPVAIALGDTPGRFTIADATGDGVLDAVITLPKTNRLMILPSLGVQPGSAPIYVALTDSPSDIQVIDLNADGNPDLATTLPGSNVLSILYGRGNNQFARAQNISVGSKPTRVTLADADEDGRLDLIVANSGDNTASVIYNRFDPNEVYRYDSDAIDPDNDPITYSIVDGPGGLIINSQTGALLWAASPDQVGEHLVTIAANDGRGGVATQSFKIDVQPARDNAAPVIATEPNTRLGAGETFTYQAAALDNDRDTLRYSLINAPAGATIDPTTGQVTWDARADMALSFAPHGSGNGFDSRGTVAVEASPSLQPASLTAEGWYNFTSLPANNQFSNIIYQAGSGNSTAYALYNSGNSNLRLELDYPSPINRFVYNVPFVPQTNRWYHFAITIDDSARVAKIFVDGVERGSTTLPGSIVYNPAANAQVGDGGLFFTRAIIDNYRLWNVVRTPAEIVEGLSRQYDGDSRVVLDYRFDEPQTLNVRDFSPAGNHGYRKASGTLPKFVPGLAQTGSHQFIIGVEDGRGGFDQQSFTLEILPELRGSIRGQAFDDLDNSGTRNGSEPVRAGLHLFIDTNDNGYPDPSESQTITDASGNYQFNGLLPGQYSLRVSPLAGYQTPAVRNISVTANTNSVADVALAQVGLGQIRGQLRTEAFDPLAYWKVFADLDANGQWDETEPLAISDRQGGYALAGLSAGEYTVRAQLPAGWNVASGTNCQNVTLAANSISTGNDFTLTPTNTSVSSGLQFVTTPQSAIEARQTFRYAAVALGIGHEAIRYDLPLAPAGMSIDPASGLMAWRPTIAQVGPQRVIVRATTLSGSIALQEFTLDVSAPNTPPTLSGFNSQLLSSSPTYTLAPDAYVGLQYALDLHAQDAEGQAITYTLLSSPSGATLDSITGQLRWTPSIAAVGLSEFMIELSDALGASTTISLMVQARNTSVSITPFEIIQPRTVIGLGQNYFARLQGVDALQRPLTWSLNARPVGMTVSPAGTIEWTPRSSDLGQQSVALTASSVDGQTQTYNLTISVVGRPVNTAPQFDSTPTTSAVLGQEYRYDLITSDADRDWLSFTLLEAPAGMSIHPTLGTLRWTPAADQLGESRVSIQMTDPDGATATQSFQLKASRSGGPPSITSVPPTEAAVGNGYVYSVQARDAEGDPLVYRLLSAPTGMTIVATTGVISWTPQADQLGLQDVVIEVVDGIGGAATQAFAIRVAAGAPNQPPVISSTAPRFGAVGAPYSYALQASDPEATVMTYSLAQAPGGMTIDPTTGLVAWTPTAGQVGKFVVTLVATDAGGASAVESFELDILAANSQPTIISRAPLEVAAGVLFTYQVLARDADFDQLGYTLVTAPVGAAIDSFGKVTWQTAPANIGEHDFTVRVTDPRGGVITQSFTLNVIADVIPPRVSLIENLGDANRNVLPWQGPFVVFARAIDNVAVASLTLSANGQDIPLSAAGTATFTFEEWGFQRINATATAIDTNGNVTTRTISFDYDFPEGWSGAGTADIPTVAITSPVESAAVFGMVTITGTASHANFAGYKLSYRRVDETTYTQFFESSTAVTNGTLAVWDTSLLRNDEYILRLEAATNSGVVNVSEQSVGVSGDLKLGNFNLSFTDLVVPVSGIPIAVTRVYDSLQADQLGDFGYGWRLDYRDAALQVGVVSSGLESLGIYTPLRTGVKVYLNLPGQSRLGWTFSPSIRVLPGSGGSLVLASPRFTPDPGNTAELSAGSGQLFVNEFGELFASGNIPWNPASPDFGGGYRVRTADGRSYFINGRTGKIDSITDANGNQLALSDSGISGVGVSVTFERDQFNRVVAMVAPNGGRVTYQYDSAGDLVSVTDANGNVSRFIYNPTRPHYLDSVIDPLGNTGIRGQYDADGRIVSITDASGNSLSITTNVGNGSEVIVDQLGNQTIYQYDARGNTVAETDALGRTTTNTFDANNNRLTSTDPLGRVSTYTYDLFNNLLSVTDPAGGVTRFTYADARRGLVRTVTDPLGNTTTYTYDSRGNQISVVDSSGLSSSNTFDARGNFTQVGNPVTGAVSYTYDARGNVTSTTDVNGNATTFTYNALGQVTARSWRQTVSGTVVTLSEQFEYDLKGNLVRYIDALGHAELYEYDAANNLVAQTDALGRVTRYTYNANGDRTAKIFPDATPGDLSDNPRIQYAYDALGRLVSETDELGRVTRTEYDAVGRAIAQLFPDQTPADFSDNPRVITEYDAAGQTSATLDANGNRTEFEYDLAGNVILMRDALGHESRFQYDAMGRRTKSIDALGNEITYTYDRTGRLTMTAYADGTQLQLTHDSRGLLLSQIDQNGRATAFQYDSQGRISQVIEANGATTSYTYDEVGNLRTLQDANGNVTVYQYDALSRRTSVVRPLGEADQSVFDAVGNLVTYTDFNGDSRSFEYDQRGRLTRKSVDGQADIQYSYLANGLLSSVIDGRGMTSYTYDQRDRRISETAPDGALLSYSYDSVGNVLSLTSIAGTTTYQYDTLNRIAQVTDITGGDTLSTYDALGRLIRTEYPNGVVEARSYTANGYVASIETSLGAVVLDRVTYTHDAKGQRLSVTELSGRRVEYQYDNVDRLVSETIFNTGGPIADRAVTFAYDAVGNRMLKTDSAAGDTQFTYDANDRLLTEVRGGMTTLYAYDLNGNQISRSDSAATTLYVYSPENYLLSVDTNGDSAPEVTYQYDAFGNRVSRTQSGSTVVYQVDTNRGLVETVAEYSTAAGVLTAYTLGNSLIAQHRGAATAYYHADSIGSVRKLTDETGAIVNEYTYDAFGGITAQSGSFVNEFLFDGQRRDATTGLDYLRARNYDPSLGRLTGTDPFDGNPQRPGSLHDYSYAGNNPINASDPTGRISLVEVQFSSQSLLTIQKSFSSAANDGLKRVGRIADKLLYPGAQMQNIGMQIAFSQRADRDLGYEVYLAGTYFWAAGFAALQVAISGIYTDTLANIGVETVKSAIKGSSSVGAQAVQFYENTQAQFDFIDRRLKLKDKFDQTFEFKKPKPPIIDRLIDSYIKASSSALSGDGLARYVAGKPSDYETAIGKAIDIGSDLSFALSQIGIS